MSCGKQIGKTTFPVRLSLKDGQFKGGSIRKAIVFSFVRWHSDQISGHFSCLCLVVGSHDRLGKQFCFDVVRYDARLHHGVGGRENPFCAISQMCILCNDSREKWYVRNSEFLHHVTLDWWLAFRSIQVVLIIGAMAAWRDACTNPHTLTDVLS